VAQRFQRCDPALLSCQALASEVRALVLSSKLFSLADSYQGIASAMPNVLQNRRRL